MIQVTPKAVERIRQILAKECVDGGLRLAVQGGGCSGLTYQFKVESRERPSDHIFAFDGAKVLIDPKRKPASWPRAPPSTGWPPRWATRATRTKAPGSAPR